MNFAFKVALFSCKKDAQYSLVWAWLRIKASSLELLPCWPPSLVIVARRQRLVQALKCFIIQTSLVLIKLQLLLQEAPMQKKIRKDNTARILLNRNLLNRIEFQDVCRGILHSRVKSSLSGFVISGFLCR